MSLNFLQYTGLPLPIVAVSAAVSNEYYGINDRYGKIVYQCKYIKQHPQVLDF